MRNAVKQIFLPPVPPQLAVPTEEGIKADSAEPDTDLSRANSPKPAIPTSSDYPDKFVELNAGKIPLDIAIVESLSSAGLEDRVKRFASSIIIVGGGAKMHGMSWALQSRQVYFHNSQRLLTCSLESEAIWLNAIHLFQLVQSL